MEYVDIKVKLPSTITIKIPSFSDIPLHGVAKAMMDTGIKRMKETITDRAVQEFLKQNERIIGKAVKRLVAEKEKEIKKILQLK